MTAVGDFAVWPLLAGLRPSCEFRLIRALQSEMQRIADTGLRRSCRKLQMRDGITNTLGGKIAPDHVEIFAMQPIELAERKTSGSRVVG